MTAESVLTSQLCFVVAVLLLMSIAEWYDE